MKIILAIVQDEDAGALLDKLAEKGQRATRISSTGGFLRTGNTTILMGVEDEQIQSVIGVIRQTCKTRKKVINTMPFAMSGIETAMLTHPIEVEVGGAHIFTWSVDSYVKC